MTAFISNIMTTRVLWRGEGQTKKVGNRMFGIKKVGNRMFGNIRCDAWEVGCSEIFVAMRGKSESFYSEILLAMRGNSEVFYSEMGHVRNCISC